MEPQTAREGKYEVDPLSGSSTSGSRAHADQTSVHLQSRNQQLNEWLDWQSQMITGTLQAEIYEVNKDGIASQPGYRWPDDASQSDQLTTTAVRAFKTGSVQKQRGSESSAELDSNAGSYCYVAQPVLVDHCLCAVVAFKLQSRTELQLRAVIQLVNWGVRWLVNLIANKQTSDTSATIDFLQILPEAENFTDAVARLCDALGSYFSCDRVSIGVARGLNTRVIGVTQNVKMLRNSSLQQDLEAAMTEACDFKQPIVYPDSPFPALCHRVLSRRQGMNVIYTQPLRSIDRNYGAITLERIDGSALSRMHQADLASMAPILGHQIQLMVRREYSLSQRIRRVVKRLSRAWVVVSGLVLLLTLLCFVPASYNVDSDATVEGTVQRVIVAPVDGYIAESYVRAGDTVQSDTLLAQLEDRDLLLEREKWQSEYDRNAKSYKEYLATHQRAESEIAKASMRKTQVELDLINEQLHRSYVRAPFAGIIVGGDFSQSLGTPVARGQVLFEIAPLDNYHVVSEVHERDIAQIEEGQSGQLRLMGMPDQQYLITVSRIAPIATAGEGRNYFQVEARIDAPDDRIRPGMQGITKLDVGERSILWIWTHRLWSQVRLWMWSLGA